MATFDLPAFPETPVTPRFLLGAASPLWGFYGAAAAGGVTYWWMTRWTQPANLEALFGALAKAPEAMVGTAEAVVEAAVEAVEPVAGILPMVGGEAAPISPVVEMLSPEPVAEAVAEVPQAVAEAAREAVETVAETVSEVTEPITETAAEVAAEAPVLDVAPEPPVIPAAQLAEPDAAPKPRVRKAPPATDIQA